VPAISRLTLAPLALGFALALGGCGKNADEKTAVAAGGEVLAGTISDGMIDLDTSTASPPLAAVHSEAKKNAAPDASAAAQEAPAEADAPAAESADTE
jgi:hypothetical protein